MIKIERFVVGEIEANCFFVTDDEENLAFLVDTGDYSFELKKRIKEFGAEKVKYILLTHGHLDHIGYASEMREEFPSAKIVIGKDDAHFTNEDDLNLSSLFGMTFRHFDADILVEDGSELAFGSKKIKVISTPGHTKGGVCYIFGDCIFTGDTLFRGCIGRTDFPTSSTSELIRSVKERLFILPEETIVYPGHGGVTTIGHEKLYNPFIV